MSLEEARTLLDRLKHNERLVRRLVSQPKEVQP